METVSIVSVRHYWQVISLILITACTNPRAGVRPDSRDSHSSLKLNPPALLDIVNSVANNRFNLDRKQVETIFGVDFVRVPPFSPEDEAFETSEQTVRQVGVINFERKLKTGRSSFEVPCEMYKFVIEWTISPYIKSMDLELAEQALGKFYKIGKIPSLYEYTNYVVLEDNDLILVVSLESSLNSDTLQERTSRNPVVRKLLLTYCNR